MKIKGMGYVYRKEMWNIIMYINLYCDCLMFMYDDFII